MIRQGLRKRVNLIKKAKEVSDQLENKEDLMDILLTINLLKDNLNLWNLQKIWTSNNEI